VLRTYLPAIVFLVLGGLVGSLFAVLNLFLGKRHPNRNKADPYECGLPSDVQRGFRFGISFYLVAMLFILFDIEIVFMYPWAVVYRQFVSQTGPFLHRTEIFWSMLSFVFILTVGYVYAIMKGALDWKR